MKKLYIIAAAALTLGATSCDDTLDKQPLDEIVSNTQYWANDDNVQTQIDRFYNDYSGYGNGGGQGQFYFNALSDDQTDNSFANWPFTNIPASSSSFYLIFCKDNLIFTATEIVCSKQRIFFQKIVNFAKIK